MITKLGFELLVVMVLSLTLLLGKAAVTLLGVIVLAMSVVFGFME